MEKVKLAAEALIKARETNQPLVDFPDDSAPQSIAEAFAIQDEILISRGAEICRLESRSKFKRISTNMCRYNQRKSIYIANTVIKIVKVKSCGVRSSFSFSIRFTSR